MTIQSQVPLRDWTWWKIGGSAEHFALPETPTDVAAALRFAHERGLALTVLGGGTNVLVSDAGVAGLVLCTRKLVGTSVTERDGRLHIEALAGTMKAELTKEFLKRRLAPALFLCGLPGDVGGGVVMNAGVREAITPREFHEITDWIEVMDVDSLHVRRYAKSELTWSYRASQGWQPGVVLRAGISWPLDPDADIPRKVKDATRVRLEKQPLNLPSCGSTFKNPHPQSAGALIEQAGLKGFRVGGAEVSTKHANFIVNIGGATAQDVITIIRHIQKTVEERFNVRLETEVKLLGRW